MAMTPRRWFIWLSLAAALAVAQVVAEPPGDGPADHARESVVYGDDDRIRFDHSRHAQTPCASCHGAALTSQRASDGLRPPMAVCASCHAGESAPEPRLETCGGCHVGHDVRSTKPIEEPEDWQNFRPAPMPRPKRDEHAVRFNHARHVSMGTARGEDGCSSCHGPARSGAMKMPSMASCQTCHNGSASAPPSECTTCHPTSGKKLETTVPGGELKPSNHGVNWKKAHGTVAASQVDSCTSCHIAEEDCAGCHVEEVAKPFAVHPPNYMAIHAVDARSDMGECTDCHRPETFCASCHTNAKAVTRPEGRPPERLQYHPPGWLDGSMPNNHGVMARRNISECASCHVENDCVTCHTGVNPHPPGFRLECGSMARANPAMCQTCHTDIPDCL